jgi:hypothetical protein
MARRAHQTQFGVPSSHRRLAGHPSGNQGTALDPQGIESIPEPNLTSTRTS